MQNSRRLLLGVGAAVIAAGGAAGLWYGMGSESPRTATAQAPSGGGGASMAGLPAVDPILGIRAIGRADAPVTVQEFFSLTCSHCATFHRDTMPRVKKELVDTGKMRMVFQEFPLDQIALTASVVARSLPEASYEPFVGALLASQDRWAFARGVNTTDEIFKFAALAGMSRAAFDAAVANEALRTAILKAQQEFARMFEIQSTPSFVFNGPGAKNRREAGARSFDDFARLVQEAAG
jgi:protein-disulfide isomerase